MQHGTALGIGDAKLRTLVAALSVALAAGLALSGCGAMALRQKERQMELVARDWSMTIRASQVIPVYPLTQDLLPGDVFVVQMSVAEQSRSYRDRGFLPTDLQVARLGIDRYAEFYGSFIEVPEGTIVRLPRDWRGGHVQPARGVTAGSDSAAAGADETWVQFPRAGFPSYVFEVANRGGLGAALPVQGIPVAMSITGAARARGTVTISDAITYGIDAPTLYAALSEFVATSPQGLVPPPDEVWSLRVVTRVFAARRFDIVISATETTGFGVDVGAPTAISEIEAPPPLDRSNALEGGLTVAQINTRLKALEAPLPADSEPTIAGLAPGTSLRATFASGRTVGFQETYAEPIVVGYHGFDVAIDSHGNIGTIVPTFAVLNRGATIPAPTALSIEDTSWLTILSLLRSVQSAEPLQVEGAVRAAAGNDPSLAQALDDELRAGRDPVAAWGAATRAYIDAEPASAERERRRQRTRDWLNGAVREAEISLARTSAQEED